MILRKLLTIVIIYTGVFTLSGQTAIDQVDSRSVQEEETAIENEKKEEDVFAPLPDGYRNILLGCLWNRLKRL